MNIHGKTVRVGLIGTGGIATDYLLPALSRVRDAVLWSVLSRRRERAESIATANGAIAPNAVFTDLDSFLQDPELDAVIIATPDRLHAQQAIQAARAGKHVFVEKPLATSAQDAAQVVDVCAEMNIRLSVGYHLRWHSGHRLLARSIARGDLGTVKHARIQWTLKSASDDWRRDDALGKWWALAAVGTHQIDLLSWFLGPVCGPVARISAFCANSPDGGRGDATAMLHMQFQCGATAEILSSVLFKAPRLIEIYGTKATAVCTDTLGPAGAGRIAVNANKLEFSVVDPYEMELADFVRAILEEGTPESDGKNGELNVALLEQATSSAEASGHGFSRGN